MNPQNGVYGLIGILVTALASYAVAKQAHKKGKEDVTIAKTGLVIESWQDLAESNKDHWDECEEKCKQLQIQLSDQQVQLNKQHLEITELKSEMHILRLQISGKMNIHAKFDQSNNPDNNK